MGMASLSVAQSSSATTTQTLYLIDGYAQFFRAYHAIRTPMSSPVTSEPTHMTFLIERHYMREHVRQLSVQLDRNFGRAIDAQILPTRRAHCVRELLGFGSRTTCAAVVQATLVLTRET